MKKLAVTIAVLAMTFGFSLSSNAITLNKQTINFDDLDGGLMPDGYMGFDWNRLYVYEHASYIEPNGYSNGLLSLMNEVYNINNEGVTITKTGGGIFSFSEIWLTSSNNDDLQVLIKGTLGSQEFTDTFSANTSGPTYKNYIGTAFESIDSLYIQGFGGVPTGSPFQYQFVLDAPNKATPAPEPSSIILGIMGLSGFLGLNKKRV